MKTRRAFTLIELLVVIAIIALLMAILMPALSLARKQAQAAACLVMLKQLGIAFAGYTNDNDGYFMHGWIGHQGSRFNHWSWMGALKHYKYMATADYNQARVCPAATKPWYPYGSGRGSSAAWIINDGKLTNGQDMTNWGYELGEYGSYGNNRWIYNPPRIYQQGMEGQAGTPVIRIWEYETIYNWRTVAVRGTADIPVLADATWVGCHTVDPTQAANVGPGEAMGQWLTSRHSGGINMLFMDWSARKVRTKCLWGLKWNKTYDTCNIYTRCSGVTGSDWSSQYPNLIGIPECDE